MEGKASDWRPGPTVCRCCLTEGCYKDISTEYFWMGKREVYAEMLSETLNVSIAYSQSGGPNSNSRLICEPCISRLRDASEFKRQVIDCEKTFMHHLDPGSSSKSREFTVDSIGEVKVEVVKREKESLSDDDFDDRPDFLDVDTDDDLDDQPLTKLASKMPSKVPKKEVDLLDLLDSSQITVKRKSNLKLKAPPKKVVKKKEVVKPAAVKVATPSKQVEKKKDDEWTTLDASDIKVNPHSALQNHEWITTDIKDAVKDQIKIECTRDYVENEEWVTTDFTETIKLEVCEAECSQDPKINFDDEWVVSDMTNTVKTKIAYDNTTESSQSSLEQGHLALQSNPKEEPLGDEWTTTVINPNDERDSSLQNRDSVAAEPKEGKAIWARLGQKMVKILVDEGDYANPMSNVAVPRKRYVPRAAKSNTVVDAKGKHLLGNKAPKRGRQFVDPRTYLHNARLILKHTTAIPFKIQLKSIDVPCFACQSEFDDPVMFREHFNAEHKTFDKTAGMNIYKTVQTRVDITDLACLECGQSFDTLDEAALHLFEDHKINMDMDDRLGLVPLKFPQTGQFICVVCQKQCMSFRDLYRHTGIHFPFHVCEVCGDKFESMPALKTHINRKHGDGCRCKHCNAVFPTAQQKKQHVQDGCTGIKCKICKVSFTYSALLQKHRETVHGAPKRWYKCGECPSVFEKRMQLYFHKKREHTEHYKCSNCGKHFTDSSSLRRHMLVHTDERPFKCHICNQGFKNRSYIKIHVAKCKINAN